MTLLPMYSKVPKLSLLYSRIVKGGANDIFSGISFKQMYTYNYGNEYLLIRVVFL